MFVTCSCHVYYMYIDISYMIKYVIMHDVHSIHITIKYNERKTIQSIMVGTSITFILQNNVYKIRYLPTKIPAIKFFFVMYITYLILILQR